MNTRASLLIAAILCVVGSALCQTAPKLPQQFTTNYTIVIPEYPSPVYVGGFLALDILHGGAFADIGGEEWIPVSFHTNFVASPDNQGTINGNKTIIRLLGTYEPDLSLGYMYEGPLCWNMGMIPIWMVAAIPFQIPENSTYLGTNVISGQSCTGWYFEVDAYGSPLYVTLWVSTSNSNSIVQVKIDNIPYSFTTIIINFFNTVVGPFSPYIYAPPTKPNPSITCTQAWTANLL